MHPDERCCGCGVDARSIEVAACSCHDTTHKQTENDGARLHDRATKAFADDDADEDEESKADELSASPWQWSRSSNVRAKGEETIVWTGRASA